MSEFSVFFLAKLIFWAGIGQLLLVLASPVIPLILGWRQETARLGPLTRRLFWTYTGYIWCTNLSFGLVSVLIPRALLEKSPLATAVAFFIAVYWGARLVIRFASFRRVLPTVGWPLRLAKWTLEMSFAFFTAAYALAAWYNLGGSGL
jgi:hypothetical protein